MACILYERFYRSNIMNLMQFYGRLTVRTFNIVVKKKLIANLSQNGTLETNQKVKKKKGGIVKKGGDLDLS